MSLGGTVFWVAVLAGASAYLGAFLQRWWAATRWAEQTSCASCRKPVWRCRCQDGEREAVGKRLSKPGV